MNLSRTTVPPDTSPGLVWNRLAWGLFLLWCYLAMCFPLHDTDFWWHLRTGDWILGGHGIPYVDLYTFADADKAWIDLHWGFQILVALLYRLGGVPLVTLIKAGFYTAAIALAWRAGGAELPSWKKAAVWLLPSICITGRGNERPEMISLLFLAFWLLIVRRIDRKPRWIWYLPLAQVVWVNCHALFVLGLIVGVCFAVDAIIREWMKGQRGLEPRTTGPDLRTIGIVGALVGLACFINPYFEEGALFPLTLYRKFSVEKEFYSNNIGEFQPPMKFVWKIVTSETFVEAIRATNVYLIAEIGTWLIAAFSFVWLLIRKGRWSVFRLLVFAGFSHLAWQATRNTNIFALIAGFVACENFGDAQLTDTSAHPKTRLYTQAMVFFNGLFCILVATGIWNQIAEKNKPFRLGEAPNWFIHKAAKFAAGPGFPKRAFVANNGQAEVYVYHNGPEYKVFMDARLEVCTQRTFETFNNVLDLMSRGSSSWEGLFRSDGLPVVILDSRTCRQAINGMFTIPTWRLVFADATAAVFLPVGLANQLQLPLADPTPLKYPDGPPK